MNDYWIKRALKDEVKLYKTTLETVKRQEQVYKTALFKLQQKIDLYSKQLVDNEMKFQLYKANSKVDNSNLKLLNLNLEQYLDLAKRSVITTIDEIQLTNSSLLHRLTVLEALKEEINITLNELALKQEEILTKHLENIYEEAYYVNTYQIQTQKQRYTHINRLDSDVVNIAIHNSWIDNSANFSERIWNNTKRLSSVLYKTIAYHVAIGSTPYKVGEEISRKFGVELRRAVTLAQTEASAIRSKANLDSLHDSGVDKYMIVVSLDEKTCDTCGSLDGKIFEVKQGIVGVTMHPYHPNCRCTEVAYFEGITDNERSAKNFATGKNENINYMTYKDWKNNYVGAETLEKYQKIDKNKYADKRQYEEYKKVLKNNPYMPKKLEDFINIKYNNFEEYTTLKFRYKLVSTDFSKMILKRQKQLNHKLSLDSNGNYTVKYGKTGILGSEKLKDSEYYNEIRKQVQNLRGTGYIYFRTDSVTNINEYREYFIQDTPYGVDILKNSNTYKYKKAFEIRYDKNLKYHITPVNEDYYKKGGKL